MTEDASGSVDAPGTLAVRVTMNPRLWRAAFGTTALLLAWSVLVIGWAVVLVVSAPDSVPMLAVAALLVGWSGWGLWRTVPHARRRHRVLSMGVPTLQLDDLGVRVRDVPLQLDPAALGWADCAAVVVSAAPKRTEWPVQPVRYVQFVPMSPDRIQTSAGRRTGDVRAAVLGVSDTQALVTWLELPGSEPGAQAVVEWLRTHQPGLKVVGAGHSVSDE